MRMGFSQRAYTMIESMVVLLIVSALLSQGAPALSQLVSAVRLRSSMTAMTSALRLARYEAIRRNTRVVLCKSPNGKTCSSTGGWEQGWVVFFDDNNNLHADEMETLLYVEPLLSAHIRITGNAPVSDYVSYSSQGRAKLVSGAFQAGTLTVCETSSGPTQAYQVIINMIGNPRVEKKPVERC